MLHMTWPLCLIQRVVSSYHKQLIQFCVKFIWILLRFCSLADVHCIMGYRTQGVCQMHYVIRIPCIRNIHTLRSMQSALQTGKNSVFFPLMCKKTCVIECWRGIVWTVVELILFQVWILRILTLIQWRSHSIECLG